MKKKTNWLFRSLWLLAVLVQVKSVFADFGPDQTYALATSYRHLMGDGLFAQMWEPHQTSSFLADFGLWLYTLLHPSSFDGCAIFLQVYGVLLYSGVTLLLYRFLQRIVTYEMAQFMSLFFFVQRAKLMVFPEFSNMHILFSALILISLGYYYLENKRIYLVGASLAMCLLVLSYPSCVLTFFGASAMILCYSKKRVKDWGLFTGICAVFGLLYIAYFSAKLGVTAFIENLKLIFLSDVSHTGTEFMPAVFFRGCMFYLIWFAVVYLLAYFLSVVTKKGIHVLAVIVFMLSDLLIMPFSLRYGIDWTTVYYGNNAFLMLVGSMNCKKLSVEERTVWNTGMILSVSSCFAVLVLTNQEFISVFNYMILGTMVSFLPVSKVVRGEKKSFSNNYFALLILWMALHRLMAVYGYINVNGSNTVFGVENYIRVGPAKGIVTSLSEVNEARISLEEWQQNVTSKDTVFMVEYSWYDPIVYFYTPANIGAYSMIDTPTYDESLAVYWGKYPEKIPNVIAVKKGLDIEDLPPEGWFTEYLASNYSCVYSGYYWNFYRLVKNTNEK